MPKKDYSVASSLTDLAFNKATNLQASKQDKILNMNPSSALVDAYSFTPPQQEPVTNKVLTSLVDADSGYIKGMPGENRFSGFDAYEVQHSDPESLKYFQSKQGQKKMERQREVLASQLGIPKTAVTDDMIHNAGMDQTYQVLNALNTTNVDLISRTMRPDGTGNIFGKDKPLNLPIQVQDQGKDYYGRGLIDLKGKGSDRLLSQQFNTPEFNTDYGHTYDSKNTTPKMSVAEFRKWNAEHNKGTGIGSLLSGPGATLANAANRLGSKFEYGAGEALETLGELQAGYEKRNPPKDPNAIGATWGKSFSEGLDKAGKYLKQDAKYGETLGEQYYKPSHIGSKTASNVWKELKQGNIGEAINKVTAAGTIDLIAESLPEMAMYFNPVTFSALYGANVTDAVKEYEEQNPGKEVTSGRLGAMMVGEAVSMALEKVAINKMVSPTDLLSKGEAVIAGLAGKVAPAILKEASKYVAGRVASIGSAGLLEGGQEVLQEGQRVLSTQYGTGKDLLSEENIDRLGTAGVGGSLAGGGIRTGVVAPGVVGTALGAVKDTTNVGLNKLSEISTGRTAEDVRAKKQAEVDRRSYVTDEVNKRMVEITPDMTPEQAETANDITNMLADAREMSPEEFKQRMELVDDIREKMGFNAQQETPVEQATETTEVESTYDPVNEAVEQYKATGATDSDVAASRLHAAGLDQMETLKNKQAKVGVELIGDIQIKETSKKKGKLFDPNDTTDEAIATAIDEGYTAGGKQTVFQRMVKKLGYGNKQHREVQRVAKDVSEKLQNESVRAAAEKVLPKGTAATRENVMRMVAIGVANIRSADIAESDIHGKYGVEKEGETGARGLGLDVQIGKAYVNAFGARFTGTAVDTARAYKEKGDAIINLLKELDMVDTDMKEVPVHNMVNPDGKKVTKADLQAMPGVQVREVNKVLMASLPNIQLKSTDTKSKARIRKDETADALSTFSKMFTPNNYEMVSTEGQTEVPMAKGAEGVKISEEHKSIIKGLSELKYQLKPEAIALFKELKAMLESEAIQGDMDKLMRSDVVQQLLGIEYSNAALIKMSESGRSIARKDNLAKVLENIDEIEAMMKDDGGFNYSYESAINERIHVMQTILEFQGDKYMGRQVVTGGKYTTKSGKARKILVDEVTDELGVTEEAIEKADGALGKLFKAMDKNNGTLKVATLIWGMNQLGLDKPFKAMSLIKAAYDIHKSNGEAVTTNYVVESDATASGVMNTLLNLSGFSTVRALLEKMGIKPSKENDVSVFDPYSTLSDNAWDIDTDKNPELQKTVELRDELLDVMTDGSEKGVKKFLRNLAKSPMMTWFYGQSDKNTMESMGNSIAVDLAKEAIKGNKKAIELINSKLESVGSNTRYSIDGETENDSKYRDKAKEVSDIIDSGTYIVWDTETTSNKADSAEILQVGAIKYVNGKEAGRLDILLPSKVQAEEGALNIWKDHKVGKAYSKWQSMSDEEVSQQRKEAMEQVKEFLSSGEPMIAHYGDVFDNKVLRNNGIKPKNKMHDSISLARYVHGSGNASMDQLNAQYRDGKKFAAHDALADAEVLAEILGKMKFKQKPQTKNIKDISKADVTKLGKIYGDTIGELYVKQLGKDFKDVVAYRNHMNAMYDILEKTGKWEGTLQSAMSAIADGTEKMSIQKLMGMTLVDVNDALLQVNQMMNNKTSFSVNLQHSTDAAILLMTVKKILEKRKAQGNVQGIMTVHDALYSDADTAIEIMKVYNEYAVEAAIKYDYVQAGIKEAKEAISKMKDGQDKKHLEGELKKVEGWYEGVHEQKVEFLQDLQLNILGNAEVGATVNPETYKSRQGTAPKKNDVSTAKSEAKKATAPIREAIKALKVFGVKEGAMDQVITELRKLKLSKESKGLLDKMEQAFKGVSMELADEYSSRPRTIYLPRKNSTQNPVMEVLGRNELLTPDTLIEILAHETDHAVQLSWILNNKDSNEVKYISRVVEKLITEKNNPNLSQYVRSRLDHVENAIRLSDAQMMADKRGVPVEEIVKAYQVSELSAILMNEKAFQDEVTKVLAPNVVEKTFNAIKEFIKKAYKTFSEYMNGKDVGEMELNLEGAIRAMESLNDQALANIMQAAASNKEFVPANAVKEKDLNPKEYKSPLTAFNDGVAASNRVTADWMIIWGDVMADAYGASIAKAHRKMKHAFPIYREVVNLVRHGFYDSDWGQRFQHMIRMSNDTKTAAMREAMSLFDQIKRASATERGHMMEMRRQIEEKYSKKERVVVHRVFADTGIANLVNMPEVKDALLNGERTVAELLDTVSAKMSDEMKGKLDDVAKHLVDGDSNSNAVNVRYANTNKKEAYVYVTLRALSMIDGGEKVLVGMDKDLQNWMMSMALANKQLNDQINENADDYQGVKYSRDAKNNGMYDGSYSMDIYDKHYETKMVSLKDLRMMGDIKTAGWEVLVDPTNDSYGYLVREDRGAGRTTGVGMEMNRYVNGLMLSKAESDLIHDKMEKMDYEQRAEYLNKNKLVQDGNRFRVILSKKVKREKLGLEENAAHSLFMTYIHNKELVQAETIRQLMLEQGTRKINNINGMKELERVLRDNDRKGVRGKFGERTEVEPFVSINYNAEELRRLSYTEIQKQFPMIAKYYRVPEGLSSFNDFNKQVSLVKRGVAEILLGHENFSLFGKTEHRELAKYEQLFKKMIIAIKMKMVVTNPYKLMMDTVSNIGILSMMDIGVVEIYDGMKEGLDAYKEYAAAETKMVNLGLEARLLAAKAKMDGTKESEKAAAYAQKKLDAHKESMKGLRFYDAATHGYMQSYSTDLITKEFDSISGLQKDIDNFIDKYTHDKKGDPNKLFEAIKWWQGAGVGMDQVFRKAGELASKKRTDLGTELIELADRLKKKKDDKESVARYISDFIGAPASEAVNYGSAYMVLADALSKYVLAQHLMGRENPASGKPGNRRKYTKEEAYAFANDTFIDYRENLPSEVKALSDYGIMMFPAFWMKIQRTIVNLLRYHPVSTVTTFAIEKAMTEGNTHIMNQAIPLKFGEDSVQSIVNNPVQTIADNPWSVLFVLGG